MPGNVKTALAKRSLTDAFRDRPQYQQDDYLKWITSGAGPTVKQQRIDQMLEELEKGDAFKGAAWTAAAKQETVRTNAPVGGASASPGAPGSGAPAAKASSSAKPAAKPAAKSDAKPATVAKKK